MAGQRGEADMTTPTVKVKPLEWSDVREPNEKIRYTHVVADSPIGTWSIEWKSWKDYDDRTIFLDGYSVTNGGDTLEDAKEVAQAEFGRRILPAVDASALTAEVERLRNILDQLSAYFLEEEPSEGFVGDVEGRSPVDTAIAVMRSRKAEVERLRKLEDRVREFLDARAAFDMRPGDADRVVSAINSLRATLHNTGGGE